MATDSLFQDFLSGDSPAAFRQVYRAYLPQMKGWCAGRLDHCEDIEDVIQDVLMILLQRKQTLKPGNLTRYLKRATRYAVNDVIRKRRRVARITATLAGQLTGVGLRDGTPLARAEAQELLRHMLAELAKLQPRYQALIRRFYLESTPAEQLSGEPHISVAATYARLQRAVDHLALAMGEKPRRTRRRPKPKN